MRKKNKKSRRKLKKLTVGDVWDVREWIEELTTRGDSIRLLDPSVYDIPRAQAAQIKRLNMKYNSALSDLEDVLFELEDLQRDIEDRDFKEDQ